MSDEIPFHIQAEIIKRLPVVPLLQFRSVSKAWKSLIDSSAFIASHSVVTHPHHLLVKYEDPVEETEEYVSFVDDDTFPQQRFVHTLPHSIKLLIEVTIVGSSHGLFCLRGYCREGEDLVPNFDKEAVVLWNPSIRKSITLPLPSNPDNDTDTGFGVCPVTGEPKIVEMMQFTKNDYHCEARVYTLSSGKWRNLSLSNNLPSKQFRILWPQVVVDRFIYWCAFDPMASDNGLPNHNYVMSFNTSNESFGEIDLPDNLKRHSSMQLCVSKVREFLVVVEYNDILKRACNVWKMEDGVEKSFTKLFTVEAPYGARSIISLGFRKNGEAIMEVEDGHSYIFEQSVLVQYDPEKEWTSSLEINGANETFSVNSYKETLLLHGRSDCNDSNINV